MTSLREASHGRPVDHVALLDGFLSRLEVRIEALRGGRFDVADWTDRQLTTGREVTLIDPSGAETTVRALGVDGASGALVVADDGGADPASGRSSSARSATSGWPRRQSTPDAVGV